MTDEELLELLNDLESDRAERKVNASSSRDKLRETICAFANDLPGHGKPGVLFIGVDDHGNPTGLEITDEILKTLSTLRDEGNILPLPSMDVQKRELAGHELAVVTVFPSESPPVKFRGRIYIRVGPTTRLASRTDEQRLIERRRFKNLPYDIRPVRNAGLDELDELHFRRVYLPSAVSAEVIEENARSLEQQFEALKLADPGPPPCPTVLGILTIGKTPTDWIPGAYIQFLRIEGDQLGDPIKNQREIFGSVSEMLNEMDDLLKVNIQISTEIRDDSSEVQQPDYPLAAIQQIARNAVMHRSYEGNHAPIRLYWFRDRIEILSPGGPFGQVTKDNFGTEGAYDYRNPNLAAVMKELGYVQRFGYGIPLARRLLQKNGNPGPKFQVEDTHILATLRART